MYAYKGLLETCNLSIDILVKFQRALMKPYNFTTRRHRLETETTLDSLYALIFHYVSCE